VGVFICFSLPLSGQHSETRQGHTKEQIGKKSAHSHINSTGMSTHDNNIGSRKVEPEMQKLMQALQALPLEVRALKVAKNPRNVEPETPPQPLWRLKANYLMRQLARIWYGKLPIRDYPNSLEFESLFLGVMCQFVEDHGISGKEVVRGIRWRKEEFEAIHGKDITFRDRGSELYWVVSSGIPRELHETFVRDETIQHIIITAAQILDYEKEGEEPPYKSDSWLKPLDYYEQLPVLEPEPKWRLIANYLMRELARLWYGKTPRLPNDFYSCLKQMLFEFAIENGLERKAFMDVVYSAQAEFEEIHGCEPTFKTPIQEIIWIARKCLPEKLADEFLRDPQVRFVLTAAELIWAFIKAGLEPPYEKYAIRFEPLDEYEELPVFTNERPF
jgi:hypothetical protein